MATILHNMIIQSTLAFWTPGPMEFVVLAILGLLLFGRRLPEVGRSLGRSIVEFRKGIKGIEDEVEEHSSKPRVSSGPSGALPTSESQHASHASQD
ncbi:MAG: twin-arginine translocase TatA/TatE family subunit [Phycisphaerales bacterium]|nr:twin-arginine translocase TatA/TatE family subunit [Phycisphaerales bacterium]